MTTAPARLATALGDRYRIERELGAGGMATVYLARDLKHDRDVALKVLRPELTAVLGADRFLNEVRITARLDHPHILTLIDSGADDSFLWYVLPYVRGESLRDLLTRDKQLGIEQALAITRQVAGALDFAHRQGVIHRDIKPENILLQEGEAMLADFGIALAVKEAGGNRLTETGLSLGTPQYMSPEQATGDRQLDARSDVYSLGAVLYEMLTGNAPHTGATAQAVIAKLMMERPTRIRTVRDTVPEGIDNAVAKALAKTPADRFGGAGEFARALVVSQQPEAARPPRRWQVLAATVVVAVGGAAALYLRFGGERAEPLSLAAATQLTTTGKASTPVLSPDGSQVAYVNRTCDAAGQCTARLMIRETGAGVERVLLEAPGLWVWGWSGNGMWLLFWGQLSDGRAAGVFAMSRSGGAPIRLGMNATFAGGDTVLVLHGTTTASPGYVHTVLLPSARVLDSVRLQGLGAGLSLLGHVTASPDGRRLTLAHPADLSGRWAYYLYDRAGRPLDSMLVSGLSSQSWAPDSRSLLLIWRGEAGVPVLVRMRVGDAAFGDRADTLLAPPAGQTVAELDLSADGRTLTYEMITSGGTELWTYVVTGGGPPRRARRVVMSTAQIGSWIAGDGRTVFYNFAPRGAPGRPVQPFVADFDSGAGRAIIPPVDGFRDWLMTSDGRTLFIVAEERTGTGRITRYDVATGRSQPFADLPSARIVLWAAPDGGLAWVSAGGDSIVVADSGGRIVRAIVLPDSMGRIPFAASAPDHHEIIFPSVPTRPGEEFVVTVYRASLATGAFRLVARQVMADVQYPSAWTSDGWYHLAFSTPQDPVTRMYRVRVEGGTFARERDLPGEDALLAMSVDGRRMIGWHSNATSDIYLMRGVERAWRR